MDLQDNHYGNEERHEEPVTNRVSVWQQLFYALAKPGKYLEMLELSAWKSIKYMFVLMLLVAILVNAVPTAAVITGFGGFRNLFLNKLPAFQMVDGELQAEDSFDIVISGTHFYMDTTEDSVNADALDDNAFYVAIGRKTAKLILVESGMVTEGGSMNLGDLFADGVNNEALAQLAPYLYVSLVITFLLMVLQYVLRYSLLALIYMIFAWRINRLSGLRLSRPQVFMLCFYAQTLGILLVNINAAFNYAVPSLLVSIVGVIATSRYISAVFRPYLRNKQEN
jgi:hypothetical protein